MHLIDRTRVSLGRALEDLAVLELSDDGRGVHVEDERLAEIREPAVEVELKAAPELGVTLRATFIPDPPAGVQPAIARTIPAALGRSALLGAMPRAPILDRRAIPVARLQRRR